VKGRSRKRAVSGGSSSHELSARRVDFIETSLVAFFGEISPACGAGRSSSASRRGFSGGSFFNPPGAKTSFRASSSGGGAGVEAFDDDAREAFSFSASRDGPRCTGGCRRGLSGSGSFGSGESESWYSKYNMAHF
jgi:hypothetical protein